MNARRLIGLVLLTLLAAWLVLRGCTEQPEPPAAPPPPAREVFHAAKPLRVEVVAPTELRLDWLTRELRYVLARGKMNLVPHDSRAQLAARSAPLPASGDELPQAAAMSRPQIAAFVLSVLIDDTRNAQLKLTAPDGVIERQLTVTLEGSSELDIARSLLQPLPELLQAVDASPDWTKLLGTQDPRNYAAYLRATHDLFGSTSEGFTQPPRLSSNARTIERLEQLTRRERSFARAWAALALAYLSIGGQDERSLSELAEASAERALELEDDLGDAHAALGIVLMKRQAWLGAYERFERALRALPEHVVALESLACMFTDAGQYRAARPLAERVIEMQPRNAGAHECLAYVRIAGNSSAVAARPSPAAAKVQAMAALWSGERDHARTLLRNSMSSSAYELWAAPLLRAAAQRNRTPQALQAITTAANEGYIDAATEILCGAALRQADFVLNRMARVQLDERAPPLRILWLPQTEFLRAHERFEEIVGTAGLPAFWHQHGPPDICQGVTTVADCYTRITAK